MVWFLQKVVLEHTEEIMSRFTHDTMTFKFAYQNNEIEDWLTFANDLIERRESMSFDIKQSDKIDYLKTFFTQPFEFRLATFMLMNRLLPDSARQAYGFCIIKSQFILKDKKVVCPSLFVNGQTKGRKGIHKEKLNRNRIVIEMIKQGKPLKEVCELVADKYNKSPDTIRREHERWYQANGKIYEKMNSIKLRGK